MSDPLRILRIAAIAEASTYLCLLGGLIVFRVFDGPRLGSTIGPIHGTAFIAYCVAVLRVRPQQGWSVGRTVVLVLAAVVPIGGYVVAHRLTGDDAS